MDIVELKRKLDEHGQEHLLQFWPVLNEEEQQQLFRDVNEWVASFCPNKPRRRESSIVVWQ